MKKYVELNKNNPFSSQAKILLHIEHLYDYLIKKDSYPFFMEINPTSLCNLKCKWCISENFTRDSTHIDIDILEKFFKEYANRGGEAINYCGGGEPTLYKHFERSVNFAKEHSIKLGLMTNGFYKESLTSVVGKNFDWARFSLDTVNKVKYKEWKGADGVGQVLKNIYSLVSYDVKVGVNCNVTENHTIDDVRELVDEVMGKVSYVQFRPVLPRYFKKEKIDINREVWDFLLSEYENVKNINLSNDKLNDLDNNKSFNFQQCDGHFFGPILDNFGNICVCMYHPDDERFMFGNIYKNSFDEIWNSSKRKEVIDFVRKLNYKDKCQVCCKLCEVNKALDFMRCRYDFDDYSFI